MKHFLVEIGSWLFSEKGAASLWLWFNYTLSFYKEIVSARVQLALGCQSCGFFPAPSLTQCDSGQVVQPFLPVFHVCTTKVL